MSGMAKLLLGLLVLISFTQHVHASEKAFALLLSYGLKTADLETVMAKYPELLNLDVSSESYHTAGDEFTSHFSLKFYAENDNVAYKVTKVDNQVSVEKEDVSLYMEVKTFSGAINGTLYETILDGTNSKQLATEMDHAFKDEFTTTKRMRVPALYEFQVEQYFDDGKFVKYGSILNTTLKIGRAITKKILNINQETHEWMLLPENFQSIDRPFYAPVKTSRISSLFQLNRRHPITRRHQPHNGVDFAAPSGTPIYPALDGIVTAIGRARAKGKYVTILHANGYITTYDHLRTFQKGLKVGQRVDLNDQLGEVGRTGFSTGAHLHFGIMKDGLYVNPIFLLKSYMYSEKEKFEIIEELLYSEDSST